MLDGKGQDGGGEPGRPPKSGCGQGEASAPAVSFLLYPLILLLPSLTYLSFSLIHLILFFLIFFLFSSIGHHIELQLILLVLFIENFSFFLSSIYFYSFFDYDVLQL